MNFLGLSLRNHDANISYSENNKVKYLKFEREFNIKHLGCLDWSFLRHVFDKWNIDAKKINAVSYVTDMGAFNLPSYSKELIEEIKPNHWFFQNFNCPFFKIDHHFAHTLSIWPLTKNTDIDFVLDGMGDFEKTHSIFSKNKLLKSWEIDEAESIGRRLGVLAESNNVEGHNLDLAGKLMALKSFGKVNHNFCNLFTDEITQIDKLFHHRKYFTSNDNEEKTPLNRLASCHYKSEKIILNFFKKNCNFDDVISYTGGVAQNSVINGILKKHFKNLHIPPHCPDDGLSLGCLEFLRQHYNQEYFETKNFPFWQDDVNPNEIPDEETLNETCEFLAKGKIVGWYQGHGELGPRALGNRSILMNPMIKNGKQILNDKVKKREWFRPFGASILEKETNKYFLFNEKSEYMLYVTNILDKENFPSITHIDGTCRIQTVNENNFVYYNLIEKFYKLTGVPMLLNTSLNLNFFPICSRPVYALQLFEKSEMDVLVIGNTIYKKNGII